MSENVTENRWKMPANTFHGVKDPISPSNWYLAFILLRFESNRLIFEWIISMLLQMHKIFWTRQIGI